MSTCRGSNRPLATTTTASSPVPAGAPLYPLGVWLSQCKVPVLRNTTCHAVEPALAMQESVYSCISVSPVLLGRPSLGNVDVMHDVIMHIPMIWHVSAKGRSVSARYSPYLQSEGWPVPAQLSVVPHAHPLEW